MSQQHRLMKAYYFAYTVLSESSRGLLGCKANLTFHYDIQAASSSHFYLCETSAQSESLHLCKYYRDKRSRPFTMQDTHRAVDPTIESISPSV